MKALVDSEKAMAEIEGLVVVKADFVIVGDVASHVD